LTILDRYVIIIVETEKKKPRRQKQAGQTKGENEMIGIITMNINKENEDIYSDCSLNCQPFSIIEERYNEETGYLEVIVDLQEEEDFNAYQEQCLNTNDMVRNYKVAEEY
jgi:hypothetical protein